MFGPSFEVCAGPKGVLCYFASRRREGTVGLLAAASPRRHDVFGVVVGVVGVLELRHFGDVRFRLGFRLGFRCRFRGGLDEDPALGEVRRETFTFDLLGHLRERRVANSGHI
jgi:hypothetical protein